MGGGGSGFFCWSCEDGGDEGFADVGVGDEVEVALAVAGFDVFESVPFFGHGEERFREEMELVGVHAELAGAGAEEVAIDAVVGIGDGVFADVDLEALAILEEVREAGLAHAADGEDASGDARGVESKRWP
jgi:hypothetical protein